MTRLDEIAARLEAMPHNALNEDCAFLLAEVKRLEGERDKAREGVEQCAHAALQANYAAVNNWEAAERLEGERNEAITLARSLAEALERIERRDFLMADLKSVTTPERVAAAALSSPALLKLKGGV